MDNCLIILKIIIHCRNANINSLFSFVHIHNSTILLLLGYLKFKISIWHSQPIYHECLSIYQCSPNYLYISCISLAYYCVWLDWFLINFPPKIDKHNFPQYIQLFSSQSTKSYYKSNPLNIVIGSKKYDFVLFINKCNVSSSMSANGLFPNSLFSGNTD